LAGNQQGAWHPHWCDLLARLRQALADDWQVLVLTDRGLESGRLFAAITGHGWHPLMRVKAAGTFRPRGWHKFYAFGALVPGVGKRFAALGRAYKTSDTPLACTFLGAWEPGHEEPWLLLTDLAPQAANPCWYAWRAWIEQGFKVTKSGGWQWQYTKMTDPGRVERHWLAIAVATLWLVAVAGEGDPAVPVETLARLPRGRQRPAPAARATGRPGQGGKRRHRVFVQGLAALLVALLNREGLPRWRLHPEPWPEPWHDVPTITEEEFWSSKVYP
jgi:Transposase DDE domain